MSGIANGLCAIRRTIAGKRLLPLIATLLLCTMTYLGISAVTTMQNPFAGKAYAADAGSLTAGTSAEDNEVAVQSSGFRASKTSLDLSPKVKKVPYGHKYIPTHKTVVIKVPDPSYYKVYWYSSNTKVATAKWSEDYKNTEIKLTVYGHSRGKATITITNSATYETIKIRVVVNGYNSKDFKASSTKLNLKQKKKKVSGGYKFSAPSKTIIVATPDGADVRWDSSDTTVADAEWADKWVGNTIKLKIMGHRPGKATLTLNNSKTKKKLKIRVTVGGGYNLGFEWGAAKRNGNYLLNNFILTNKTKQVVKLDKNCAFRCWTVNANYDEEYEEWLEYYEFSDDEVDDTLDEPSYYINVNQPATIRGVPVTIKKNAKKRVYIGEKIYSDNTSGNEGTSDVLWDKGVFTAKIGKSYKTIYVDGYGMVTKVLNGRKIQP